MDTGERNCMLMPKVSNQRDFYIQNLTAKTPTSIISCHSSMVLASALATGLPLWRCVPCWQFYFESSASMSTWMDQLSISDVCALA